MRILIPSGFSILTLISGVAYAADPLKPATLPNTVVTSAIDEVKVGITTKDWVREKFGKPNSISMISDGTTIWIYTSIKTRIKGSSFVPIIGLFAGGAKAKYAVRVFTFTTEGLLQNFTNSDSQIDCNSGLLGANCK